MPFQLQDIPANNFKHLNHFFQGGYDSRKLVEQSQSIRLQVADVRSWEWFFDGIRMGYSEWDYKENADLKWSYHIRPELITFQANLNGSIYLGNPGIGAHQLFGSYQHNLFYANAEEVNEGFLRPDDNRASMFFMQFTKEAFLRITQDGNEALNRFNENVINQRPAILSVANLPVEANMFNLIKNIVNCSYKEGLKKMFLLSKSIELLVLQAEACNMALVPEHQYIKTPYDKECIQYAREYLMKNLDAPPGLSELSKIVGINEYKLKRGFKEVYGNTVFGYLSDARLEVAKNELLAGKQTISELATVLGYSSVQHFSNAFRKKFGVPPGRISKLRE